jgi:type II secretory pathway component PulF
LPWYTTAAQSRALLRLVAVAIEEKLPLSPLIEAWAMDERGVQRGKLRRLASLLGSGMALDDAIEEVPGLLRPQDLLGIRFDMQSGTRTAAMRALLDDDTLPAPVRRPGRGWSQVYLYLCVFPLVAVFLVTFIQLNILPVFLKILREFSVPLPEVVIWSQQFGNLMGRIGPPVVGLILVVLWFLISTSAGRRLGWFLSTRLFKTSRTDSTADVLQLLGVAIKTSRPLAGTLSTLARYHFDPAMRQKLLLARNEVEQGADVWQSLIEAGLLTRPEAHLLNTGERLGNQPWTMRQLVSAKRQQATGRREVVAVFLWPLVIIALGGFVLFQALTIFVPLLEILRAV